MQLYIHSRTESKSSIFVLYKDEQDIFQIIAENCIKLQSLFGLLTWSLDQWLGFEFEPGGKKKLKIIAFVEAFNILTKLSLASNKTSFIHKTASCEQLEQYLLMEVASQIAQGSAVFYRCVSCVCFILSFFAFRTIKY